MRNSSFGKLRSSGTQYQAEQQIRHWLEYLDISAAQVAITFSKRDNVAAIEFVYNDHRYMFQSRDQDNIALNMWAIAHAMEYKTRLHVQNIEPFAIAMEHYMLGSSRSAQSSEYNLPQQQSNEARDPYQVLGISRNASIQEIRLCYIRLMKAYHPDMALSAEAKEANEQRSAEINEAYTAIKKEKEGLQ